MSEPSLPTVATDGEAQVIPLTPPLSGSEIMEGLTFKPKRKYRCSLGKGFLTSEHEAATEEEAWELFKKKHGVLKWHGDAAPFIEEVTNGGDRRPDGGEGAGSGESESDYAGAETLV